MRAPFDLGFGWLLLAGGLAVAASGCGTECPAEQCGEVCVDLKSDSAHCGACGAACEPGFACVEGTCTLSCQQGLQDCDGTCADLQTDRANCGQCGHGCGAGEVCWAAACALSCQNGLDPCAGRCVDRPTDREHCGRCGYACIAGEVCSGGACGLSCQHELADCGGTCVDLESDRHHCGACGQACAADAVCAQSRCYGTTPVTLQLLNVSDFHGQLDPSNLSGTGEVGGAAVLSSYFQADRAANPNTLTLASGDCFGASPPLSSLFDEQPTLGAMNLLGFDAAIFGNHAFDRGLAHLQASMDLSQFAWVSTNLTSLAENLSGVRAPYELFEVGGVRVAVIGLEAPETCALAPPGTLGTLQVADPVGSAMAARAAAEAQGARVFVALAHLGATGYDSARGTWNGPLIELAQDLDGFQVVFGGHTHRDVSARVNGTVVAQTLGKGLTYARVRLSVVPLTGAVVSASTELVTPLGSAVTADPALEALLAPYRAQLAVKLDQEIGVAADLFPRENDLESLGEAALGNLVTDSMRAKYGTQLALLNGASLRAPLPSSYLPADLTLRRATAGYAPGPAYDLVKGDAFTVLPLGSTVVTRTITGAQLWRALEHSVSDLPAASGRFLQISGFRFTYRPSAVAGSRVTSVSLANGTPIGNHMVGGYTVALPDFLDAGGEGYSMLVDGNPDGFTRDPLADVLADYIQGLGSVAPFIEGRIAAVP